MPGANPYADLRSLLDSTRQITPEELAELHLEQGFVDRALRIYEELARAHPTNGTYATRRAWLARMSAARPVRPVPASEPPRDRTLRGLPSPVAAEPSVVRELRIVRVR